MTEATLFAFLTIFVRCSAMLVSSPMFSAQNTPLPVRIFTTVSISAALTMVLKPQIGGVPADLYEMASILAYEVVAGLLLGSLMNLVLQAAQMGGAILDIQMGLGISQVLNPVTGVQSTILAQFKHMLALVVFLSVNAHHTMLQAFVESYRTVPSISMETLPAIQQNLLQLIGTMSLLGIQMAAPVLAVTLVVDAALGIVNKAVPQMQVLHVGMPAKVAIGMVALGLGLPAVASGVSAGVDASMTVLGRIFGG